MLGYTFNEKRSEYALWRLHDAFSELVGRYPSWNAVVRALEFIPDCGFVNRLGLLAG